MFYKFLWAKLKKVDQNLKATRTIQLAYIWVTLFVDINKHKCVNVNNMDDSNSQEESPIINGSPSQDNIQRMVGITKHCTIFFSVNQLSEKWMVGNIKLYVEAITVNVFFHLFFAIANCYKSCVRINFTREKNQFKRCRWYMYNH